MDSIILSTPRLVIFPLTYSQLNLYLDQEAGFNRDIGPTSRAILNENLSRAIGLKLEKMLGIDQEDHPWITYWLIKVLHESYGVGMIGFKGIPNAEGEVEIGYGIDPEHWNKGYTTEAVTRLIQWAFTDPRCTRIIAPDTQRSNMASNRVLEKVGMRIYEESEHAISWCLEKQVLSKS